MAETGERERTAMRFLAVSLAVLAVFVSAVGASPRALFAQTALPASPPPSGAAGSPVAAVSYPPAPTSTASDVFFGTVVPDPYRALESIDAPTTKTWVAQENALTRRYLDAIPARPAIGAAFRALYNYPKKSQPFREGTSFVFTYNTGLQTQNVYYIRKAGQSKARVFFDPNVLSKDGSIQATQTVFSKDGSLMAYATSAGGEDWESWHVKTVATRRDATDLIHWSKFSTASWYGNRGFYYAGYDAPTARNKTLSVLGVQKVWFHKLGTPQSADRLEFASTAHSDRFVGATVSDDQRLLFLSVGALGTTQFLWRPASASDTAPFVPFTSYVPNVDYSIVGNDGRRVYLYTNQNAPRFRVVAIDLNDPRHRLVDVVAQTGDKLDGVSLIGNTFYLGYLHDAYSVVRMATTSGKSLGTLALPGLGAAGLPSAKREDRIAYYDYTSYGVPRTIYRFDTKTATSSLFYRPPVSFDANAFVTEQFFATSKDGTKIPVFVTHRKDIALDGTNPTLMYGYGGFDISETPYYSTSRGLWLKMGGVYADVILRGGGEFGEAWHDAGRLGKKQHVFDDFIAAGQLLIDRKITSTPKLAIDGGSNGGLLVGATLTQRPDLFGAAIAEQGVLDMLRYQRFTVGKAWVPEYGDATASKAAFDWLSAYSPLHNLKAGTSYPPTMITTSDHDDRVYPAHSFKFAAALQAAQAGPGPILLRVQTNEGHFSGLTTDEEIAINADFYAFLAKNLHFTPTL